MKHNNKLLRKIIISNAVVFCMINLLEAVTVLLDEIIIARGIGSTAMAAVGLSSPVFAIMSLFASVLAIGSQSLSSTAMGMGDSKKMQEIFSTVIVVALVIISVITLAGYLFMTPVCLMFGAGHSNAEVFHMLQDYLAGIFAAIPGYVGYLILSPFVMLNGKKKVLSLAAGIQCLINLVGDYISVYILNWGILGVGLFTGFSWFVALLTLVFSFFKDSTFRFDFRSVRLGLLKSIAYIGSPKFSRYISKIFSKMITNHIIVMFGGNLALSVFSVNHSLTGFLFLLGCGLSDSIVLCTQLVYVEKERDGLIHMMKLTLQILSVSTGVLMLAVLLFAGPIASIFVINDEELLRYTVLSVICLGISIPFNALNDVIVGYLQGARKIKTANTVSMVHRFVSGLVISLILGYLFGIVGLFIALPLSEVFTFLVYLAIVLFNKKESPLREALMLIPKDFGADLQSSVTFTIAGQADVVRVSEQITDFLEHENYTNTKNIYWISLCAEELAANIVKHGFTMGSGKNNCEMRVILHKDQSLVLRVRDDCPKFDVRKHYQIMSSGDPYANIGIKLIFGLSSDVKYNNLLGYNNTVITLQ